MVERSTHTANATTTPAQAARTQTRPGARAGRAGLRARAERVKLGGRGVEARLQGRDPGAHARVHPARTKGRDVSS